MRHQEVIISQRIKVDSCIAQEIVWLNSVGVSTLGCCCGHGVNKPEAIIKPSSVDAAGTIGYMPVFNVHLGQSGEWEINLKSKCNCNCE